MSSQLCSSLEDFKTLSGEPLRIGFVFDNSRSKNRTRAHLLELRSLVAKNLQEGIEALLLADNNDDLVGGALRVFSFELLCNNLFEVVFNLHDLVIIIHLHSFVSWLDAVKFLSH